MNKKQKLLNILNYAFDTANCIIDYTIDDTGLLLDINEPDIYESHKNTKSCI
jgi:hypothetical protein